MQAVLYHTLSGTNRVLAVPRAVAAILHAVREALAPRAAAAAAAGGYGAVGSETSGSQSDAARRHDDDDSSPDRSEDARRGRSDGGRGWAPHESSVAAGGGHDGAAAGLARDDVPVLGAAVAAPHLHADLLQREAAILRRCLDRGCLECASVCCCCCSFARLLSPPLSVCMCVCVRRVAL